MTTFQRIGSTSNAHVGRDFESIARAVLQSRGITTHPNYKLLVGIKNKKKYHAFDLGSEHDKVIVECKSHRWTAGGNIPSAKITVWNEAMYYFALAPKEYQKIFFCLKDKCTRRSLTLAEYYIKQYGHLIPPEVQLWEWCEIEKKLDVYHLAN